MVKKTDELLHEEKTCLLAEQLEKIIKAKAPRVERKQFADGSGSNHDLELYTFNTTCGELYFGFVKTEKFSRFYTGLLNNPRQTFEMTFHYKQSNRINFRLYVNETREIEMRCFGKFTIDKKIVYEEFWKFIDKKFPNENIDILESNKLKLKKYIIVFIFESAGISHQFDDFIKAICHLENIVSEFKESYRISTGMKI
jgi:hypothetical protein